MSDIVEKDTYPYEEGDDTTEGLGNEDGSLVVVHSVLAQELAHAA